MRNDLLSLATMLALLAAPPATRAEPGDATFCQQYAAAAATAAIGVDLVQPGNGQQWRVAVPMKGPQDWQGSFQVDGKGFGNGGGNQMSGVGVGGWSIAWLGESELSGLRKGGREGLVGVETQDYEFPLAGVAAAIQQIEDCRRKCGIGG